jgi:WD40 repeat protein
LSAEEPPEPGAWEEYWSKKPFSPSPLDQLDPAHIPREERCPGQPEELVAVVGTNRGHAWGGVSCIAYSPDGKRIATCDGRSARLWKADTLEEVAVLEGHNTSVTELTFGPVGGQLASGDKDGVIRLWDLRADPPRETALLEGHSKGITSLSYGPGGRVLASGSKDGTVRLWHLGDGEPVPGDVIEPRFMLGFENWVSLLLLGFFGLAAAGTIFGTFTVDFDSDTEGGFVDEDSLAWLAAWIGWVAASAGCALICYGYLRTVLALAVGLAFGICLGSQSGTFIDCLTRVSRFLHRRWFARIVATAQTFWLTWVITLLVIWLSSGGLPRHHRWMTSGQPDNEVTAVRFSPNGQMLAVAGGMSWDEPQGWGQLWELQGNSLRRRAVLQGALGSVDCLAFTPDGATLVSGCNSDERSVAERESLSLTSLFPKDSDFRGGVALWNLDNLGNGTWFTRSVNTWNLLAGGCVWLLVMWLFRSRRLWDPAVARVIRERGPHPVLVALAMCLAVVWFQGNDLDLPGRPVSEGYPTRVTGVAFSPDGATLASSSADGRVRLWTVNDQSVTERPTIEGKEETRWVIAFAPDGRTLASAGTERKLRLWELDGETPREGITRTFPQGTPWRTVGYRCWLQDGREIYAWTLDGIVPRQSGLSVKVPEGIQFWDLSADGKRLLGQHEADEVIGVWDVGEQAARKVGDVPKIGTKDQWAGMSPDGKWVLTTGSDEEQPKLFKLLEVFDDGLRRRDAVTEIPGGEYLWSPDSTMIAVLKQRFSTSQHECSVHLLDVKEHLLQTKAVFIPESTTSEMCFSPDGHFLVLWGQDWKPEVSPYQRLPLDVVRLWDVSGETPKQMPAPQVPKGEDVRSVAISPDGELLVTASAVGRVAVYRTATGRVVHTLEIPGAVDYVDFAPDGRHLLVANRNRTVYVLRLRGQDPDDRLLAACEEILKREPDCVDALVRRGEVHLRRGRHEPALADAERAIRLDGNCRDAYWVRALVHAEKKRHDEAIADFTFVLRLDPKNARAYYNRGLVWTEKGNLVRAKTDLARALELDPRLGKENADP